MKKVLLTGASGFIGRHVLDVLQSRGIYEIHAVRLNALPVCRQGVFWHQADILDVKQVDRLISTVRPDFLMHFAWYTVHGQYWTSDKNLCWEKASINLVKKFYANGGQRIVGAGTCAEYSWDKDVLSEKESPLKPATLYGQCKLRVGSFLCEYSKEFGISSAWGRIFLLYGPYENPCRLVSSVICSLLQNKPILCTHGEQIRDFLYVKDVASAFVSLLESNVQGAVNVASGKAMAIKNIVNAIGTKLNKREIIRFGELPAASNEPNTLVAKVERLNYEVGWQSGYDMDTGLEQTISWWKEQENNINESKN